jgi:hypothetical protein
MAPIGQSIGSARTRGCRLQRDIAPAPTAQLGQCDAHRNLLRPSGELTFAAKRIQTAQNLQQGLLRKVLDVCLRIGAQPIGQGKAQPAYQQVTQVKQCFIIRRAAQGGQPIGV